jgi:hypothetical protein
MTKSLVVSIFQCHCDTYFSYDKFKGNEKNQSIPIKTYFIVYSFNINIWDL